MTEPISDFDLNMIRNMFTKGERFNGYIECLLGSIGHVDVAKLIARLDLAEAKLEKFAQLAQLRADDGTVAPVTTRSLQEILDG